MEFDLVEKENVTSTAPKLTPLDIDYVLSLNYAQYASFAEFCYGWFVYGGFDGLNNKRRNSSGVTPLMH